MATLAYVIAGDKIGEVYRCPGATAPILIRVDGVTNKFCLGYWESRFEVFDWACCRMRVNSETAEWEDAITGEILDYWQLEDEMMEEVEQ